MSDIRIEATVQADGELHLTKLPCRRGDRVEAVIRVLESRSNGTSSQPDVEAMRAAALKRFFARADVSRFCSQGLYPTRDELHERH